MKTRRELLLVAGTVAVAGCSPGTETAEDTDTAGTEPADTGGSTTAGALAVSTPAFEDGGTIPERYTGVGEDVSPPLSVDSVPEGTETLALVVDDPDANNYLHWLIWNIPAGTDDIPEGIPQEETVPSLDGARQGTNDFGELGYRGPLPPADDGPHTYQFTTYAVDTTLDVEAGAGRDTIESAVHDHRLGTHGFTGEFDR